MRNLIRVVIMLLILFQCVPIFSVGVERGDNGEPIIKDDELGIIDLFWWMRGGGNGCTPASPYVEQPPADHQGDWLYWEGNRI